MFFVFKCANENRNKFWLGSFYFSNQYFNNHFTGYNNDGGIRSLFNTFGNMAGVIRNRALKIQVKCIILDTMDCCTCSFTEFVPFCPKLYYFSNFKDFNTPAQA